MKRILFVCLSLVFSSVVVFAQTTNNQTDANGKKQGMWEEKTAAGILKGSYTDDQKDGCWTSYAADGKLIRIEHFSKGLREGIAVDIDQRGYLVSESYYEKDLLEGTAKRFYYGTNPASLIDYVHGKINGKKKVYYENSAGKIQEESDYKNDIKHGASKYYTIKGDLIAEYNYVDGLLQGVQKSYYAGNILSGEQEFKDNVENGFTKEYYESGKLKSEGVYVNGVLNGQWKDYNEVGVLKFQGNYVNGEKDGKWQELDANGKVVKSLVYVKGQLK